MAFGKYKTIISTEAKEWMITKTSDNVIDVRNKAVPITEIIVALAAILLYSLLFYEFIDSG
jgi:hypothetical protein